MTHTGTRITFAATYGCPVDTPGRRVPTRRSPATVVLTALGSSRSSCDLRLEVSANAPSLVPWGV
jgi:hypothetical protein